MGSISGTVTSKTGRMPAEVTVLIDSGPPHPEIAALAGTDGRFSLPGLVDGDYQISAYVDGVRQAGWPVRLGRERFLGQERDAARHKSLADGHGPMRRDGDVDDIGLRRVQHRVDVREGAAAPSHGDGLGGIR